jgi:hypothetical protein
MRRSITHLVLGGGGLQGITYIGVLRFLAQEGLDKHITHVAGSSIGALFGMFFVLGVPLDELEASFKEFFRSDELNRVIPLQAFAGVMNEPFCIEDDKRLAYIAKRHLVDPDITFMQLAKRSGKHFVVCAACLETKEAMHFSIDTTPHVRVRDAVIASMSVPLMWPPMRIGDRHYIDGCTVESLPYSAFAPRPLPSMLCITLGRKCDECEWPCKTVAEYLGVILQMSAKCFHEKEDGILKLDQCPVRFLPTRWVEHGMQFQVSDEDIDASIAYGYTSMHAWFITDASLLPLEERQPCDPPHTQSPCRPCQ